MNNVTGTEPQTQCVPLNSHIHYRGYTHCIILHYTKRINNGIMFINPPQSTVSLIKTTTTFKMENR